MHGFANLSHINWLNYGIATRKYKIYKFLDAIKQPISITNFYNLFAINTLRDELGRSLFINGCKYSIPKVKKITHYK